MQRRSFAYALVLVVAAALPGCLGDDKETNYHAAGLAGTFVYGFGYDGIGIVPFEDSFITIHANDADNTGLAYANGTLSGRTWTIAFDAFSQSAGKDFQDGGIAANLQEHGATGVADTSIPEVTVDVAAWGSARVTIDGEPLLDPISQREDWVAHYMVILTGVRDNATGEIFNEARTDSYDPANASDGFAQPGDEEIHLILKSQPVESNETIPVSGNSGGPVTDRPYQATHPLAANPVPGSAFQFSFTMSKGTGTGSGSVTVAIKDPNGEVIDQQSGGFGALDSGPFEWSTFLVLSEVGQYTLEVSGSSLVNVQYDFTGSIAPPKQVVMYFTWEDIVFGDEAAEFESERSVH